MKKINQTQKQYTRLEMCSCIVIYHKTSSFPLHIQIVLQSTTSIVNKFEYVLGNFENFKPKETFYSVDGLDNCPSEGYVYI